MGAHAEMRAFHFAAAAVVVAAIFVAGVHGEDEMSGTSVVEQLREQTGTTVVAGETKYIAECAKHGNTGHLKLESYSVEAPCSRRRGVQAKVSCFAVSLGGGRRRSVEHPKDWRRRTSTAKTCLEKASKTVAD